MVETVGNVEQVIYEGSDDDRDVGGVNTAMFRDFSRRRSLVATHLHGCTMLVIIGRKGVYMGHYWENISFDPDTWNQLDGETPADTFQRTVITGLRDGKHYDRRYKPEQMSLTDFAQQLRDDHVKPTPTPSPLPVFTPAQQGYPQEWQLINGEVIRILPKIGKPNRWEEILYDPPEESVEEDTSDKTPSGRDLVKFDPEHQIAPGGHRGPGPQRLVKMWVEYAEVHSTDWYGN
ncbi:hypothetical protein CC86DRAFT_411244 [Ophiobolus disseminans]|uniref:Uncharacterized protein n=1 Tax=Ophiobolus disseminans TaxID=1469910 RepID=A0A6A6ZLC9_9PLEO|nr:hypothetical protein CC86DRAFT_411244 [Ophiobolus disseminans]